MTKIIKKILCNSAAKERLINGIDQLADAVKVTLGPKGRCVVIGKQLGIPTVTKDGVTVANSIFLEDHFESMGCDLLKEAARQTAKIAGDGTTTAIILAQAFVKIGWQLITKKNKNPIFVAKNLEELSKVIISKIKELSQPVQTEDACISIATIAANNDKDLGKLIGQSVFSVGSKAPVIIEESNSLKSYSEIINGYSFNGGLRSPRYYNVPGREYWQGTDVSILIVDRPLSHDREIEQILDAHMKKNKFLFVICADCSEIVNSLLVINAINNKDWHYRLAASYAPEYGEQKIDVLNDIALLTGATIVTLDNSRPNRAISEKMLGHATFVKSSEKMTVVMNEDENKKEALDAWILDLEGKMEHESDDKKKEFLKDRIQKLKVGTLTLRIGGSTRYDVKERLDRVDDAVRASQCALDEGYLPGGGIALLKAADLIDYYKLLDPEKFDTEICSALLQALYCPLEQIIENAGLKEDQVEILDEISSIISNMTYGIDLCLNGTWQERLGDMIEKGIIDPTKVVCTAIEKAASIAAMILSTDALVADLTDVEAYNRMVNSGIRM